MAQAQTLVETIIKCFDDDTYSDLRIVCGDRSWKVHRVIVCSQSKVLHAACMTGFKVEAQTGVIDLEDDDPVAVEIMLRFFYTGEYIDPVNQSGDTRFNIRFAVIVHILADKYDVPALMRLAEEKFMFSLNDELVEEDYLSTVSDVYTLPGPTNTLRNAIVKYSSERVQETLNGPNSDLLKTVMLRIPEFAFDILVAFVNAPLYRGCKSCGLNKGTEGQGYCVKCRKIKKASGSW